MQMFALVVIVMSATFLAVIAGLMWTRPERCLHWLSLFASTRRINLTELGLRALAGAALVVRAPEAREPALFDIAGWFLIGTAILLVLVPRRWHAGYAVWWSHRLPVWVVRASAPVAAVCAAALVWLAL